MPQQVLQYLRVFSFHDACVGVTLPTLQWMWCKMQPCVILESWSKKRIQKNEFNCSNETKRNVLPPPSHSLAECVCCRVNMRAPGSHLATFRPISFPRLMTERGPGSSLILSTSGCSTESVSTNNPIYQRLQTNCKHPTLLPLLFHITVSCLVGRQTAASRVVRLFLMFQDVLPVLWSWSLDDCVDVYKGIHF